MHIKFLKDEDFVNYKEGAMFIGAPSCSFKCCIEQNLPCSICQNYPWSKEPIKNISNEIIINRYLENPLTSAIIFGGLEPFDNFEEIYDFIKEFRNINNDTIIIYTGYNRAEIEEKVLKLKPLKNIIIKFGRYIPNEKEHYDSILGVNLASDNQYAEKI